MWLKNITEMNTMFAYLQAMQCSFHRMVGGGT